MKPQLQGERVLLRSIGQNDVHDLFEIYGDKRVMEFASDPVFSSLATVYQMMESVEQYEQSQESFEWAITEVASNKVIGTCGIHNFQQNNTVCEIGCLLNAQFWRNGYMRESLSLLIDYTKTLGIKSLIADIDAPNIKSKALFESLGFIPQARHYVLNLN